jgi:hypothetical protein
MDNLTNEYLTCGEILQEYPVLAKDYQWDLHSPSRLFSLGLLEGKYLTSKRTILIKRSSIESIVKFYSELLKRRCTNLGL